MSVWYENALHFFLQCPLNIKNLRINFSSNLIDFNFEVNMASLLFWVENLSQAKNIAATYKIRDYIKDTNIFGILTMILLKQLYFNNFGLHMSSFMRAH